MADDAPWYEAALLVGITNALNVVADAPLEGLEPARPSAEAQAVFDDVLAFYRAAGVRGASKREAWEERRRTHAAANPERAEEIDAC